MSLIPYLNFNGNTKEVMDFYVKVFNLKEAEITYFKDMPEDPDFSVSPELGELVMHGSIDLKGDLIMFSDSSEELGALAKFGDNVTIMYSSKDIEELKDIFSKLSEGGKVIMPFAETFWTKGYGNLVDKFGIGWQLNLDEE